MSMTYLIYWIYTEVIKLISSTSLVYLCEYMCLSRVSVYLCLCVYVRVVFN